MKIVLVGPGMMPIPPLGWGAVESVIWEIRNVLLESGNDVYIINISDKEEIINQINKINPDFINFHVEDLHNSIYDLFDLPKAITSHRGDIFTNIEDRRYTGLIKKLKHKDAVFFLLSQNIKNIFVSRYLISSDSAFVVPNGVNTKNFAVKQNPILKNKSVFLGKIEDRKRQYLVKDFIDIDFIGPDPDNILINNKNYIGQWTREQVFSNLTEYGNLILLSESEGQALVCLEALAAGLGLVVSKGASANLDTSLPFITVIDENMLSNPSYIKNQITKNRNYAIAHRDDILKYAKSFDWKNIIQKYYIPSMISVINRESKN
jgi:glycosyltransferase involved in cell wall biosynthesis